MPSTCNGELGFWDEIPMPGGKVYCLARSLYQPTPGDWSLTSVPTCTKTVHHRRQEEQSTTDGACQAPKHDDHDVRGR